MKGHVDIEAEGLINFVGSNLIAFDCEQRFGSSEL